MTIKDRLRQAKRKRENREVLPGEEAQRVILYISLLSIVISVIALLTR